MKSLNKWILNAIIFLIPLSAFAVTKDRSTTDRMISDLEFIHSTFEVYYAPKEWKQSYAGWDLTTEIHLAKQKIQNTPKINTKKFQKIVKEFFQSTKDYHVDVDYYSTEYAVLPFSVQGVGNKYFIFFIDQRYFPPGMMNVGDELVSFNGKPTNEAIKEIISQETPKSNLETDKALASYYLTHRLASLGHTVPRGNVILEIRPKGSNTTNKYQIEWNYSPEKIANGFQGSMTDEEQVDEALSKFKLLDKNMTTPFYETIKSFTNSAGAEEDYFIGQKVSFIPPLSDQILWQIDQSNPFHAYIYKLPNEKKIGYVRIATYGAGYSQFEKFAEIIAFFQNETDALVIDQVDNPGGSVSYLFNLLSVLSNRPLYPPTEKMMITPEEVENAIEMVKYLSYLKENPDLFNSTKPNGDFPITYEQLPFFMNYFTFIISEWSAGRTLTNPHYILGFDKILPHPTKPRYTKPILLLINSLDFSGGDFFPAIMQDNKRATILGTRTAGAGGCVLRTKFPNRFGIKNFSFTASIAERINKNPIENLGVTPDIEYKLTKDDYQNNFRGYVNAINTAVFNLVDSKKYNDSHWNLHEKKNL